MEVFTTGGGWFLFNFFNAVAAIAQASAFKQALTAAMLTGAGWLLMTIAMNQRWNTVGNWMAVSTIAVYGFMAPISTVQITDNLNRVDSSGYTVSNVPFGLALFAGTTSLAGQQLTTMFEQNFADPDTPTLSENGFLFGVRLLAESTRMEIRDIHFDRSLSSYIRNCVFYDVLQGRRDMEDLKVADDPWAWITADPHVARMFEYHQSDNGSVSSQVVTCADGVAGLNTAMTAAVGDAEDRLAAGMTSIRGNMTRQAIKGIVTTELGSFHQYLIGTSRTAADILKRQMTINAVMREPARWMAETGNEAGLKDYIDARLQLQTRQSYQSIGRQAEKWVPVLKVVFQAMYIGIFPIAVLLMVTPIGTMVIRNYLLGLVWIESWAPLYAILNYMMNSSAQTRMRSILEAADGAGDITLFAQAGIQAVENDISVQAGYLSMSVPFIALGLAMGVGRFAHLASSTLSVSQEAVADTTRESATGNLSIGNTGYDSHAFHNYSGFNHNTSPHWDSGRSSGYADSGALVTGTSDGRTVINSAGSQSQLPTGINLGEQMTSTLSQSAANSRAATESLSTQLTDSRAATASTAESFADNVNKGMTSGLQYNQGETATVSEDYSTLQSAARDLARSHGVSSDEALKAIVGASLSAKIFGNGLEAQGQYQLTANSKISFDDALKASESEQVKEALQRMTSASSTESAAWNEGTGQSFSDMMEARFNETRSLDEQHRASLEETQRLEEAAQYARSNSASIHQDYAQPFVEWLQQQPGIDGRPMSADQAERVLNSADLDDRAFVRDRAEEFINMVADDHVSSITSPNLESFYNNSAIGLENRANIEGTDRGNRANVPDGDITAGKVAADVIRTRDDVDSIVTETSDGISQGKKAVEDNFGFSEWRIGYENERNIVDRGMEHFEDQWEEGEEGLRDVLKQAAAREMRDQPLDPESEKTIPHTDTWDETSPFNSGNDGSEDTIPSRMGQNQGGFRE